MLLHGRPPMIVKKGVRIYAPEHEDASARLNFFPCTLELFSDISSAEPAQLGNMPELAKRVSHRSHRPTPDDLDNVSLAHRFDLTVIHPTFDL